MSVSAQAVANVFLELAKRDGKTLSNMQLQKLVYIAQGIHLGLTGQKLYFNNTHAWQWGPVIPQLYKRLQRYGSGEVTERIEAKDTVESGSQERGIIEAVWAGYGGKSAAHLSSITHEPGTPWSDTWERDRFGIIPIELIEQHYSEKLAASTS